jgi:hypothetical protein
VIRATVELCAAQSARWGTLTHRCLSLLLARRDLWVAPTNVLSWAYATNAMLTLAQLGVPEKTNEITDLLDQLAEAKQLEGALVTIDAMGCQVDIADKIVAHNADYLLALKGIRDVHS